MDDIEGGTFTETQCSLLFILSDIKLCRCVTELLGSGQLSLLSLEGRRIVVYDACVCVTVVSAETQQSQVVEVVWDDPVAR